jgi:hypothetical protein
MKTWRPNQLDERAKMRVQKYKNFFIPQGVKKNSFEFLVLRSELQGCSH